jgi:hypothetical protein
MANYNGIILDVPTTPLTSRRYEDMTLPELLQTRDNLIANKDDILKLNDGKTLYKFAVGRLQSFIYYRRTHRAGGLIIPYDKDLNTD